MTNANLVALQDAINANTLSPAQQALLSDALGAIIPIFPDVDEIARGIPGDEAIANTWIAPLFAIGSGQGGSMFPLLTATFIDPQNTTGHATDAGPGDAGAPLLTTGELNRRLAQAPLTTNAVYTITFLSDANLDDEPVTTAGVRGLNSEIDFVGTPTVLHAGTLTAATVPMNPSAPGGGQATVLDDTALGAGGWAPFLGAMVRIVGGPRDGVSLWLTHDNGDTTAVGSAPVSADGTVVGGPQSGDSYEVVSGTSAPFGTLSDALMNGFPVITLTDFNCNASGVSPSFVQGAAFVQLERCQLSIFQSGLLDSFFLSNCWTGPNVLAATMAHASGVFLSDRGYQIGSLHAAGHLLFLRRLILGNANADIAQMAIDTGIQFQNVADICIEVIGSFNQSLSSPLIWGSNNAGLILLVRAGASFVVGAITVTGSGPEWSLAGNAADNRAWDPGANDYTAPIAGPTTWAQLTASLGSGGFGGGAHNLGANCHLMQGIF